MRCETADKECRGLLFVIPPLSNVPWWPSQSDRVLFRSEVVSSLPPFCGKGAFQLIELVSQRVSLPASSHISFKIGISIGTQTSLSYLRVPLKPKCGVFKSKLIVLKNQRMDSQIKMISGSKIHWREASPGKGTSGVPKVCLMWPIGQKPCGHKGVFPHHRSQELST